MQLNTLLNLICASVLLSQNHKRPLATVQREVSLIDDDSLINSCFKIGIQKIDLGEAANIPVDLFHLGTLLNISSNTTVCETHECLRAADEILFNLDEDANPCEDFYQFACGGWKDRHADDATVFTDAEDAMNLKFRGK
ncbi:membrane metallo-endopeptidase-like 1 [Stegodyphus dumicola]|uniref:membrane metallo-endopeptidase-like 1 n=1 Tax=Stegodyphus dumicola TaxID=202533 RepID=UPI0015AB5CF9|nr:membrane metallo-endopeptidase-like 1 [Stegodyphus dumicola]